MTLLSELALFLLGCGFVLYARAAGMLVSIPPSPVLGPERLKLNRQLLVFMFTTIIAAAAAELVMAFGAGKMLAPLVVEAGCLVALLAFGGAVLRYRYLIEQGRLCGLLGPVMDDY